jgi:hypothetical protein
LLLAESGIKRLYLSGNCMIMKKTTLFEKMKR